MKRTSTIIPILCTILVLSLAPALVAEDHHGCSYASVAGHYGYTTNGTRNGVGLIAGAGIVTLDRNGNVTDGKQTVSFAGTIADETFSGTYIVNSDCTGSTTLVVASPIAPRTSNLDLVWDDDSSQFRLIFTNAGTIITGDGKKLHTGD
jgi:hypothetical protein